MDTLNVTLQYTFDKKSDSEAFLKRIRDATYKYDVVTLNDILLDQLERTVRDGYLYGYHRDEVKKLKPRKVANKWLVELPIPSKMIRDANGYWTTENVQNQKKTETGGIADGEHGVYA